MSWMNDALLDQIRSQVETYMLPGTAVISTKSNSSDGAGGWTPSLVAAGTVACRLDPLASRGGKIDLMMERETLVQTYQFTAPYDAPLSADCVITIDSVEYEVEQLDDAHSWNASRRAIVSKKIT